MNETRPLPLHLGFQPVASEEFSRVQGVTNVIRFQSVHLEFQPVGCKRVGGWLAGRASVIA